MNCNNNIGSRSGSQDVICISCDSDNNINKLKIDSDIYTLKQSGNLFGTSGIVTLYTNSRNDKTYAIKKFLHEIDYLSELVKISLLTTS